MRKLNVNSEGGGVSSYELADAVVTVGRGPGNLIQLEDPSVSGSHAQLELVGEDYQLQDLNSTNGTRVNGNAIKSVTLRVGDRIRFGKVQACYECEVDSHAQPLPTVQAIEAQAAEVSVRPGDFENASPFPRRTAEKDPARLAILAAAAVAFLAFLASLVALLQMQPPAL